VTISIGYNTDAIETAVESFVTAYNALRDFVYTQQQTDSSGNAASDAVLFGDSTLRSISLQLSNALTQTVDGVSMSALGLSFNSKNELVLDTSVLESELTSDLDAVMTFLQGASTVSSSDLLVVSRGTSSPSSFTLDLTVDSSGDLTSVSVGGDSSLFTVTGSTIMGKSGTAYEGFTFAYTGSTSKSIDVTTTTGIGQYLYKYSEAAADTSSGSIQTIINGLESADAKLQDRVDDIEANAATYRTNLTAKYAKYVAAISEAEATLSYLEALLNASD
jgi:flagellar hook-associated protein 2